MNYGRSGLVVVGIALFVGAVIWYTQLRGTTTEAPVESPLATLPDPAPPAAAAPAAQPQYPVPDTVTPPPALTTATTPVAPDTEDSFRDSVKLLIGEAPFDVLLIPDALIHRIVVTIDNLPRERLPVSQRPFRKVAGDFRVQPQGDRFVIDSLNGLRYGPLVKLFTGTETTLLVKLYVRYYPLLQHEYRQLGYPEGHFNDRVVAVIDHLLATPEPDAPIELVRPKVFYEFADPNLEAASAGRKLLLRMSEGDRATVKTKLASIRAQLVALAPAPAAAPSP